MCYAIIPKEIARKSLAIEDDIAFVLKELLGKDGSHLKRETGAILIGASNGLSISEGYIYLQTMICLASSSETSVRNTDFEMYWKEYFHINII